MRLNSLIRAIERTKWMVGGEGEDHAFFFHLDRKSPKLEDRGLPIPPVIAVPGRLDLVTASGAGSTTMALLPLLPLLLLIFCV